MRKAEGQGRPVQQTSLFLLERARRKDSNCRKEDETSTLHMIGTPYYMNDNNSHVFEDDKKVSKTFMCSDEEE